MMYILVKRIKSRGNNFKKKNQNQNQQRAFVNMSEYFLPSLSQLNENFKKGAKIRHIEITKFT